MELSSSVVSSLSSPTQTDFVLLDWSIIGTQQMLQQSKEAMHHNSRAVIHPIARYMASGDSLCMSRSVCFLSCSRCNKSMASSCGCDKSCA